MNFFITSGPVPTYLDQITQACLSNMGLVSMSSAIDCLLSLLSRSSIQLAFGELQFTLMMIQRTLVLTTVFVYKDFAVKSNLLL